MRARFFHCTLRTWAVLLSVLHLQTLTLNPDVTLCDCPGLVFPSFVSSMAEMVTNGILPIAHLRDHTGTRGVRAAPCCCIAVSVAFAC